MPLFIVELPYNLFKCTAKIASKSRKGTGASSLSSACTFAPIAKTCSNPARPMAAFSSLSVPPVAGRTSTSHAAQIRSVCSIANSCRLVRVHINSGSKKYVPNLDYIFDPTMPSVEVECPDCGNNRAVYFLTPDEGESKIVAKMICASATGTTAKCGHIWDLD